MIKIKIGFNLHSHRSCYLTSPPRETFKFIPDNWFKIILNILQNFEFNEFINVGWHMRRDCCKPTLYLSTSALRQNKKKRNACNAKMESLRGKERVAVQHFLKKQIFTLPKEMGAETWRRMRKVKNNSLVHFARFSHLIALLLACLECH